MTPQPHLLEAFKSAAAAVALLLSSSSAGAGTQPSGVSTIWVGGPTLLFRFGPITILTDPVLGQGRQAFRMFDPNSGTPDAHHARLTPLPDLSFEEADLVLVSHDHADHLDEAALGRLAGRAPFLVPLAQEQRLRERGVAQVLGLPWRASHTVRKGRHSVRITAVPAHHSERPEIRAKLGDVNGYWLEFRRGGYRRTVYWTGDSFPIPAEIDSGVRSPDLFVPHLGGVGDGGPLGQVSMGAREAMAFARAVEPKRVLPIHHSTFSHYREPIDRFARQARRQPWKLEMLDEGEELVLP